MALQPDRKMSNLSGATEEFLAKHGQAMAHKPDPIWRPGKSSSDFFNATQEFAQHRVAPQCNKSKYNITLHGPDSISDAHFVNGYEILENRPRYSTIFPRDYVVSKNDLQH